MNVTGNLAANRRLIQVVPRLQPTRCGVSDHALALASKLRTSYGIDSAFVVLNSDERCDLPYSITHCAPHQLLNACVAYGGGQPAAILVHLSGYGYSADGAPTLLADALGSVRVDGRFRVAVFFHELYATGMPWKSAFWYSQRQKRAVRRIAETCDLLVTNGRSYVDWLNRETARQSASPVQCMPVFSHVEEAELHIPVADRDPVMAVFGLGGTRQNAYRKLSALGTTLKQLGIQEILDIGPEFEAPGKLHGIPVRRMGILASTEIARQFSRSTFGFLSYPHMPLAKSGVFAGYCAHGVIPVIARNFPGQPDGLEDGVHMLSPRTAEAAQASGLEPISIAAWRWYLAHRLHDHAAVYARWMDESTDGMEAAPESAGQKNA